MCAKFKHLRFRPKPAWAPPLTLGPRTLGAYHEPCVPAGQIKQLAKVAPSVSLFGFAYANHLVVHGFDGPYP